MSLYLTGNLQEEPQEATTQAARKSSWRPAGWIRVWDDQIGRTRMSRRVLDHVEYYDFDGGDYPKFASSASRCKRKDVYGTEYYYKMGSYVGVEGVEVRARRWFTTREGYTDSQGNYECNGIFLREANYSIKWERYHYSIRSGAVGQAILNGPKKRGDWNKNIEANSIQQFYAYIHIGVHHYYYKSIKGLRRPLQNGTFKTQMKIRAYLQNGGECVSSTDIGCHTTGWRSWGLSNPINIYSYGRESSVIYATNIHELAHASHYNMSHWHFKNTPDHENRISESWARGVQWELTRMKYLDYPGGASNNLYTQVVVDMIDPHPPIDPARNRPRDINNGSENFDEDNVTGYTIRQIEDALNGKRSWTDWRNSIINRYDNGTEENLDELFDYWANY